MTATHGLGSYGNAVGTVTPVDHKMAQLGLIVKTAANVIRTGLFWDGNATIVSGKANMSYDVRALAAVLSRSATAGAVLLTNDAVFNVVTTAAPGSNSRYDVVYLWQREFSLDGTDSNPVIGVIQGTPAASPTVPSLAAFPGAISLAQILVPAGVTATNTGTTITQTAVFTASAGSLVPVRSTTERDAGSWLEGQPIQNLTDHTIQRYNGTTWITIADILTAKPTVSVTGSGSGSSVSANGRATITAAATIALDAFMNSTTADRYRVVGVGSALTAAGDITIQLRVGGVTLATGTAYAYAYTNDAYSSGLATPGNNAGTTGLVLARGDGPTRFEFEISAAALAQYTFVKGESIDQTFRRSGAGELKNTSLYDGVLISFGNTGQWTGFIDIEPIRRTA